MREAAYLRDRRPPCLLCGFWLQKRLELSVERVSFANKHVPPPLGALDAGGAEHVQELGAGVRGQLLEVLARRVLDRLARFEHFVANFLLLLEAVALRRVQAGSARKNAMSSAWVSSVILVSFIYLSPFMFPGPLWVLLRCHKFRYK
mgnify:CR=1 FL=1